VFAVLRSAMDCLEDLALDGVNLVRVTTLVNTPSSSWLRAHSS
jgi:hypothetical protein